MANHKLIEKVDISQTNGAIIEIGSSREPDNVDTSTDYFFGLSKKYNREFKSVDLSLESWKLAKNICGDNAIHDDGTMFLKNYDKEIGVLYLDNFDIVYNEDHKKSLLKRVGHVYEDNNLILSNEKSASVHLEQIIAAMPNLSHTCFVILDDTILTPEGWWGKGKLVVPFLLENDFEIQLKSDDGLLLSLNYQNKTL